MNWQVAFYIDVEGSEPVKDFILAQPDGAIAEILHVFKLLKEFNITLGMPYVRKINKSGIRELRIKHGSDIFRIFFFAHKGRRLVLLHAFMKKEDRISKNDKDLAIKRMNDYELRY
ncbi:MAG TPA: type II toxin-antitoxin system RelE/ParE family toxin [Dehalococcoidales bacterium]|nr:type II toxin-antitoxin system RelE/ParE family toxin [Dehalococcoidales bacterium]